MEFKLWFEYKESDLQTEIDAFINKIKKIVMSSMNIKDNYASFSFPKTGIGASPLIPPPR